MVSRFIEKRCGCLAPAISGTTCGATLSRFPAKRSGRTHCEKPRNAVGATVSRFAAKRSGRHCKPFPSETLWAGAVQPTMHNMRVSIVSRWEKRRGRVLRQENDSRAVQPTNNNICASIVSRWDARIMKAARLNRLEVKRVRPRGETMWVPAETLRARAETLRARAETLRARAKEWRVRHFESAYALPAADTTVDQCVHPGKRTPLLINAHTTVDQCSLESRKRLSWISNVPTREVLEKVMQKSCGGFRYKDEGTRTITHKSTVQHRSAPRKPLTRKHKCPAFLLAIDAQIRASRANVPNNASQPAEMERSSAHPAEMHKSVAQPAKMETSPGQSAEMETSVAQPAEMERSAAQSADGGVFAWMDE